MERNGIHRQRILNTKNTKRNEIIEKDIKTLSSFSFIS